MTERSFSFCRGQKKLVGINRERLTTYQINVIFIGNSDVKIRITRKEVGHGHGC